MKTVKQIIMGTVIAVLITLGACNGNQENKHGDHTHAHHESMESEEGQGPADMDLQNHQVHESIRDNFVHKDIIILENTYQPAPNTEKELGEVIEVNLEMKEAFANDNAVQADSKKFGIR